MGEDPATYGIPSGANLANLDLPEADQGFQQAPAPAGSYLNLPGTGGGGGYPNYLSAPLNQPRIQDPVPIPGGQNGYQNQNGLFASFAGASVGVPDYNGNNGGVGQLDGSERVIDTYVGEGKFIQERVVDQHYVVGVKPFKTVEKTIEVPQIVVKEVTKVVKKTEVVERIIEKPRIEIREVIREIPVIKTVERTVEVPQVVWEERVIHVPKVIYEDRIVEVPKVVYQENVQFEDRVEYREVEVEKVVEEAETRSRVVKRRVEKPIPMIMRKSSGRGQQEGRQGTGTGAGGVGGRSGGSGGIIERQEVDRREEVPKITFAEIGNRKPVNVPMYRMVFPDGTKRIVRSIPGYPDLPQPAEFVNQHQPELTSTGGGAVPGSQNLGANPTLHNTTRPPPKYETVLSEYSSTYRQANPEETVADFNRIPKNGPNGAVYENKSLTTGEFMNMNAGSAIPPDDRWGGQGGTLW